MALLCALIGFADPNFLQAGLEIMIGHRTLIMTGHFVRLNEKALPIDIRLNFLCKPSMGTTVKPQQLLHQNKYTYITKKVNTNLYSMFWDDLGENGLEIQDR